MADRDSADGADHAERQRLGRRALGGHRDADGLLLMFSVASSVGGSGCSGLLDVTAEEWLGTIGPQARRYGT
jgi:hypothetical protein